MNYHRNQTNNEQFIASLSNILNIEERKVIDNISLFSNINPYIKNIFCYLSQMENEQILIEASHFMELLLNYHKTVKI